MQPDQHRAPGGGTAPAALLSRFLVQLGLDEGAARLCVHPIGAEPAAWSEPGVVHIRPTTPADRFWRQGGLGRLILAHEAAHLAQFATSTRRDSPTAALEREADAIAIRLVQGVQARVRLSAAAGRLHWNRVGHYYTTYLIGLMAGAPEALAQRWAFMSQVSDLVSELDATIQAEVQETLIGSDPFATVCERKLAANPSPGVRTQDYEVCRDVIEGLHCLTGAPVGDERRRRMTNAMNASGPLELGVSLHALGDAWAHYSFGTMYNHTYGHMLEMHRPDSISQHIGPYIDYIRHLLQVLTVKTSYTPIPKEVWRPTVEELVDDLGRMAFTYPDDEKETRQIDWMRDTIGRMSQNKGLLNYQPAFDAIGWTSFLSSGQGAIGGLKADDLDTILGFGRRWRVTPVDGRPASARIADAQSQQATRAQNHAGIKAGIAAARTTQPMR